MELADPVAGSQARAVAAPMPAAVIDRELQPPALPRRERGHSAPPGGRHDPAAAAHLEADLQVRLRPTTRIGEPRAHPDPAPAPDAEEAQWKRGRPPRRVDPERGEPS